MMKLAAISLSYQRLFRSGDMSVEDFIDEVRALDLDGIDLNARSLPSDERAYLLSLKRRCLRLGLPVACLSISNDFGLDGEQLVHQIATTKRWIEHALILGAPQVRVFAGSLRPGEEEAVTAARCADALGDVARYGYERGVWVALQNHNHGALARSGATILQFVEAAAPYLGHVWDTGQYVGSPGASGAANPHGFPASVEMYESLQQTVHLATHVRCKVYTIDSVGERLLDYPRIFGMLRAAEYNGFCSIVYEGAGDEREAMRRAARFFRPFVAPGV